MTASAPAQTLTEAVEAAQLEAQDTASRMTIQTRVCIAAMRYLGVKRSDYSAHTRREPDGSYGNATCSPYTPEAQAVVREHAHELADAGFQVILGYGGTAWFHRGWGLKGVHQIAEDGQMIEVKR